MTLNEDEWNEYEPVSDSTKLPNEDHGCEVDLLPNEDHGCEVDLLPNENHGCEVDLLPNGHFPSDPQNDKVGMLRICTLNKNGLNEEILKKLRMGQTISLEDIQKLSIDEDLEALLKTPYSEDWEKERATQETFNKTQKQTRYLAVDQPPLAGNNKLVYKCWDTQEEKFVAIKYLLNNSEFSNHLKSKRGQTCKDILLKESNSNGNGILESHYVEPEWGNPYLVEPWIDEFLDQRIEAKKVKSLEEILQVATDILLGLETFHKNGKTYGDLKPQNIAAKKNKNGSTTYLIADKGTITEYIETDETNRSLIGHPTIRSPRLFISGESEHPRPESDMYSLGNLVYSLFTGEELFEKELTKVSNNLDSKLSDIERYTTFAKEFVGSSGIYTKDGKSLDSEKFKTKIKKKLKNEKIPREFRKVLTKCLTSDIDSFKNNGETEKDHIPTYTAEKAKEDFKEAFYQYMHPHLR